MSQHIFNIFFVVTVAFFVSVPKRIIESELYSVFFTRLGNRLDDVGFYRRIIYGILRGVGVPKAKAVVVLCDEHNIVHARFVRRPDPLVCVDCARPVAVNGQISVRPLGIVESVYAEVDKHSEFALDLSRLIFVRHGRGNLLDGITALGIRLLFFKKHIAPHLIYLTVRLSAKTLPESLDFRPASREL